MPIYEFYCPDNRKIYSFLARSIALAGRVPRCPDNKDFRLERMMSTFAVTGRAKEKPDGLSPPDADDPRMEQAMAEMEREFGGMDTENPDGRQLARMMRRMTDLSGEKMPEQMNEMIRRMEAGENPEKLEEEYGDVLEEPSPAEGADSSDEITSGSLRSRLNALRMRPHRDPVLYEMSEYLD